MKKAFYFVGIILIILIITNITFYTSNGYSQTNVSKKLNFIVVTYPIADNVIWGVQQSFKIRWENYGNVGRFVKIELYKGTNFYRTIASKTYNDSCFYYTVPADQITGTDYKIRITSLANLSISGQSADFFSIVPHTANVIIQGYVFNPWGNPVSGAQIRVIDFPDIIPDMNTTEDGSYTLVVPYGWSGTLEQLGYDTRLSPSSRTYTNLNDNLWNENYLMYAEPMLDSTDVVWGGVYDSDKECLEGVILSPSTGRFVRTNKEGFYCLFVTNDWFGVVTPNFGGYSFTPSSKSYPPFQNIIGNHDYTANLCTISGRVQLQGIGLAGVEMRTNYNDIHDVTTSTGDYSMEIPPNLVNLTVTPTLAGYSFNPPNTHYSFIATDLTEQDYVCLPPVGVEDFASSEYPKEYMLHQNHPNPFNPETTIEYELPYSSHVVLCIYNLMGQEVIRLVDGVKQPGMYNVVWNGRNHLGESLPSGIYVYQLLAGEYRQSQKLVLSR